MLDKLKSFKDKYVILMDQVVKPEIISDNKLYKKLIKEYTTIEPIAKMYDDMYKVVNDLKLAQNLITTEHDPEMKQMLWDEINECKEKLEKLEEKSKIMLLPRDENDDKNVIIEIRSGAGGEESSLFGEVLFRMYTRYAERNRWKVEIIEYSDTELGGLKDASFLIKGDGAYSKLKFEGGVHRVQRVPETESQGRIHTSTVTVAVLPEQEDVDIEVNESDLRVDTYRASGAGGQHVNKTDSAVRLTHIPTGMVVACQEERSQIKNRERALAILKSKLYDFYKTQNDKVYAENRKTQVGSGDRSERIRTYNYPQSRMTDHRINYTSYNLNYFLDGDLDDLLDNLRIAEEKAKIEKFGV